MAKDDGGGRVPMGAATIDALVERTVLLGGTLDTTLQELLIADEAAVLSLLGYAHGLPTVSRRGLQVLDDDDATSKLRATLPKKLALSHGLVPLSLHGRRLTVLCTAPQDPVALLSGLDELGFALSLSLIPHITTEALHAKATERVYGIPVSPRLQAVLSPDTVEVDLELEAADESGWSAVAPLQQKPPAPTYTASGPLDDGAWRIPGPTEAIFAAVDPATKDAPHLEVIADGTVSDDNAAAVAHKLSVIDSAEDARRRRRREKVLWSVDDALAELSLAESRDALLEVAVRFAYRRLKTAAVFVRVGDALSCFDVLDPFLDGAELRRFSIPVDGTHVLGRAFSLMSPSLGPIGADDPLCRLLGRTPRTVLVAPVVLSGRAVAAIVGDNDQQPIPTALLGELQRVLPGLQRGLQGLIHNARREAHRVATATASAPPAAPAAPAAVTFPPTTTPPAPAATTTTPPAPAATATTTPPAPATTTPPAPAETAPAPEAAAAVVGGAASQRAPNAPDGAFSDDVHPDLKSTAPSPGAGAKEALLQATWRSWLAHPVPSAVASMVVTLDAGGEGGRAALQRIIAQGPSVLPALAQAFPGGGLKEGSAPDVALTFLQSPLWAALSKLGPDHVAPIAVGALDDPDRRRRFAAVVAARELGLEAAVPGLGRRVLDAEPRVAAVAIDALVHHTHARGGDVAARSAALDAVKVRLRDLCKRGNDIERRLAIRAVSALRDTDAIPVLIDLVSIRPRELGEEVKAALVELCRQDFGVAERRWRAWYTEHQAEPRTTWLVSALLHRDRALRAAAADELADEGVALLGYHADGSDADRHEAVDRIKAAMATHP
jgi:hypothetical protein